MRLVLASASVIRARLLNAAGISFTQVRPDTDERALKEAALREGGSLRDMALHLAEAKALAVAAPPDSLVIGADQILAYEGRGFDKPTTLDEVRQRLLEMQGRAHSLINAVAIAENGEIVFRHIEEPVLFMRSMTRREINAYLEAAGDEILASVGAYQVEALGARLFERIEGDYFAVLGLSLLPTLGYLRGRGLLSF
jgi:septum formation protein